MYNDRHTDNYPSASGSKSKGKRTLSPINAEGLQNTGKSVIHNGVTYSLSPHPDRAEGHDSVVNDKLFQMAYGYQRSNKSRELPNSRASDMRAGQRDQYKHSYGKTRNNQPVVTNDFSESHSVINPPSRSSGIKNRLVCTVNTIEVRISDSSSSLRDLKTSIMNQLRSFDAGSSLISVKEDHNRSSNRIYTLVFRLSDIDISSLRKLALHCDYSLLRGARRTKESFRLALFPILILELMSTSLPETIRVSALPFMKPILTSVSQIDLQIHTPLTNKLKFFQ